MWNATKILYHSKCVRKCEIHEILGFYVFFYVKKSVGISRRGGNKLDERIKKMELRDDGFLEVMLKRVKDFDDYIYQQIQKDGSCLACIRDHRSKSKFYYDTKGYVTLLSYLKSHVFEKAEILAFLLYVLEDMVKTNTAKPVSMELTHIFLSYDGGRVRFLILPLAMDNWMFQKEQCKSFLVSLLEEVRLLDGYDTIGYLVYALKMQEVSLPTVLQGLHDLREQQKKKPTLLEKLFHLQKEEMYVIQDIPVPTSYPNIPYVPQVMEEDHHYETKKEKLDPLVHSETVVLFAQEVNAYLVEEEQNIMHAIDQEEFTIGRASDNALCIEEPFVSAYHAVIHKQGYQLEDLHSSNGTFVNGVRRQTHRLQEGDCIRFGNKQYAYKGKEHV